MMVVILLADGQLRATILKPKRHVRVRSIFMSDPEPITLKTRLMGAAGGLLAGLVAGTLYSLFEAHPFSEALGTGISVGLVFGILGFVFGPGVLRFLELL